MSALTAPRDTKECVPARIMAVEVASGSTIYCGAMVALNSDGKAVPASDAATGTVIGIAQTTASSGKVIVVTKGVFLLDNDASHGADEGDIGKFCYVVDDHTVAISDTTKGNIAGKVAGFEGAAVQVEFTSPVIAASAITDVAAAGDASVNIITALNAVLAALRANGVIAK